MGDLYEEELPPVSQDEINKIASLPNNLLTATDESTKTLGVALLGVLFVAVVLS